MTLSPPVSRIQQPPDSSPNATALRAATLSFGRKIPSPNNRNIARSERISGRSSTPSLQIGKGNTYDKDYLPPTQQNFLKKPLHSKSSSMVATNLAAVGSGTPPRNREYKFEETKCEGDEVLPIRGTVTARRRLFQEGITLQDSPALPTPTPTAQPHKVQRTRRRTSDLASRGVDATLLEDISSLKHLFENSPHKQPTPTINTPNPVRHVPSPDNPSLTAAILATQLSPPNSTQTSRRGSPILKSAPTSGLGSPTQGNIPNHPISIGTIPKLSLPRYDKPGLSKPGMASINSKESMSSKISIKSDQNNALLAATLAAKPKSSPNAQSKAQPPPKPPPPRRTPNSLKGVSNGKVSDFEDTSDKVSTNSATTSHTKYDTDHLSISLQLPHSLSRSFTPPAAPPPRRRLSIGSISRQTTGDKSSAALTAAIFSVASNTSSISPPCNTPQHSPLPQHLTGDSIIAASLAPSRVMSPVPKRPPAPPAPRRGRRKSLPPPPKTGLRETMRKPLKSPPSNPSSQRSRPHLVKHHPHKHAEGQRRRWRHFITDIERKRYEGLWAANKGLLLTTLEATSAATSPVLETEPQQQHTWSSTPSYTETLADCVDSLIARDIWARSRLPFDHLAEVWDLVDRRRKGRLSRDEFIVGTWLIDQSLKGRKLPSSIQGEVWQSVRRLGVKFKPTSQKSTHSRGR